MGDPSQFLQTSMTFSLVLCRNAEKNQVGRVLRSKFLEQYIHLTLFKKKKKKKQLLT